jgi:hypothetical protein
MKKQIKYKLYIIILAIIAISMTCSEIKAANEAIEISNCSELYGANSLINVNGEDHFDRQKYILTNDIDCKNEVFKNEVPLSDLHYIDLDGRGHTVSNLTLKGSNNYGVGFIRDIYTSSIHDISFENLKVQGSIKYRTEAYFIRESYATSLKNIEFNNCSYKGYRASGLAMIYYGSNPFIEEYKDLSESYEDIDFRNVKVFMRNGGVNRTVAAIIGRIYNGNISNLNFKDCKYVYLNKSDDQLISGIFGNSGWFRYLPEGFEASDPETNISNVNVDGFKIVTNTEQVRSYFLGFSNARLNLRNINITSDKNSIRNLRKNLSMEAILLGSIYNGECLIENVEISNFDFISKKPNGLILGSYIAGQLSDPIKLKNINISHNNKNLSRIKSLLLGSDMYGGPINMEDIKIFIKGNQKIVFRNFAEIKRNFFSPLMSYAVNTKVSAKNIEVTTEGSLIATKEDINFYGNLFGYVDSSTIDVENVKINSTLTIKNRTKKSSKVYFGGLIGTLADLPIRHKGSISIKNAEVSLKLNKPDKVILYPAIGSIDNNSLENNIKFENVTFTSNVNDKIEYGINQNFNTSDTNNDSGSYVEVF